MQNLYQDIFFDCDSTLICVESLDWMAKQKGIGEEITALTNLAMNGQARMEDVMEKKLQRLAPSRSLIQQFHAHIPNLLVANAQTTIATLHKQKRRVWMLTSNYHEVVDPIAELCGIPHSRVLASNIFFDTFGEYTGIDKQSPLANNLGKATMIKKYKQPQTASVMIGDGATDLACKGVADLFIGFGGVVSRENVRLGADVFIDVPDLYQILNIILKHEKNAPHTTPLA